MHVRFSEAFDYTPSARPRTTLAYPAGWEGTVKQECGKRAIEAGKAVKTPAPPRKRPDAVA